MTLYRRMHFFAAALAILVAAGSLMAAGNAETGKVFYMKRCAACHGPEGEGKAAIAKSLKVELRHLGSKEVQAKPDKELAKDTTGGIGKMKPEKGLTEQQVADLIAFLRSLAKK